MRVLRVGVCELVREGRSIRHGKDFAAILLVDRRYAAPSAKDMLPRWIGEGARTSADGARTADIVHRERCTAAVGHGVCVPSCHSCCAGFFATPR